jgi:hypothetical protein
VQYLDNATMVIKMLEQAGHQINLLKPRGNFCIFQFNFRSSSDIVDGNIKVIMGTLWKLISDFQINELPKDDSTFTFTEEDGAKNALLHWCKERLKNYNNIHIEDFHTRYTIIQLYCN